MSEPRVGSPASSGRGRRAVLPGARVSAPSPLDPLTLIVEARDEDGTPQGTYDFSTFGRPDALSAELAAAFARTVGPNGPWRRRHTCIVGFAALRQFHEWLTTRPTPVLSLTELTPGVWNDWRLVGSTEGMRAAISSRVRSVLHHAPEVTPTVRASIDRRIVTPRSVGDPAYSVTELKRLRRAASVTVRQAAERVQQGLSVAVDEDQRTARGEILAAVLATGDLPDTARRSNVLKPAAQKALGVATLWEAHQLLYPTAREAAAMGVLLACERGWNRSVINDMTVPTARADAQDGDEAPLFITDWEKPRARRAGRHGTASVAAGSGAESLELVLQATAAARETLRLLGRETDRLILYRQYRARSETTGAWRAGLPTSETCVEWAIDSGIRNDDEEPLRPSMRRIRTTLQVIDRQPRQNSRRVHNRVYVMSDPAVRAEAAGIVAAGQEYAIRTAEAALGALVMGPELLALIDSDVDEAGRQTGISPEVLNDLAAGERDTPVAGCADWTDSPWGQPGEICSASFLLCLACRNGVVTPKHVGRLVYLLQAIENLSGHVGPETWAKDWAAHHSRLTDALGRTSTPEEQAVARASVTDEQRAAIDDLLKGRLEL